MPIVSRIRPRLVQRVYFVGILQFVIVAASVGLFVRHHRGAMFFDDTVRYVVATVSAESDTESHLDAAVKRASEELHWSLAVYDEGERLIAGAGTPLPVPQDAEGGRGQARGSIQPFASVPLALKGRGVGHLTCVALRPPPSPPSLWLPALIAVIVVGVSSWLTARSLAVPLARLARTAQQLGGGDLAARVSMNRSDELGEVASAFNEMADHMTRSIRAERELLANVSHELRTPLQRIRIALDLADDGGAVTAHESLKEIAEDLGELERLVDDVLSVARLSLSSNANLGGLPPIRLEPVGLSTILERAITRFRTAHPERRLNASIADDTPIIVDPVLLRRVFDNLLENAHNYTEDPAATVSLSATVTGDTIVVEVRDEGIGIGREDLDRVFEPFFRADRSRTRTTGGLGLGLALSRRIVEAHRGKLSLESELGHGTVARVELPIQAD